MGFYGVGGSRKPSVRLWESTFSVLPQTHKLTGAVSQQGHKFITGWSGKSEDVEQIRQRFPLQSAFFVLLYGYTWGTDCLRKTAACFMLHASKTGSLCLAWKADSVDPLVSPASLPVLSSLVRLTMFEALGLVSSGLHRHSGTSVLKPCFLIRLTFCCCCC